MTADISALDVPLEQLRNSTVLLQARLHTHSPSDALAYRIDEWLVTHPDAVKATVPAGWDERIAAIQKLNEDAKKRARARLNSCTGGAS